MPLSSFWIKVFWSLRFSAGGRIGAPPGAAEGGGGMLCLEGFGALLPHFAEKFKKGGKKAAFKNMKLFFRYAALALLGLAAAVTIYITGCSDVMFEGGVRTVPCNSDFNNFGGSCQDTASLPEGVDLPEGLLSPPGADGLSPHGGSGGGGPGDSGGRSGGGPDGGFGGGDPEDPYYGGGGSSTRWSIYDYDVTIGRVTMVFVMDNSSSMHKEHKSLSKQAKKFLAGLKNIPYRIAVITTDISASPGNPNHGQVFQDGNFIPFAHSGKKFLENTNLGRMPSSEDIKGFADTIVRPETLDCDSASANAEEDTAQDDFFRTGVMRSETDVSTSGRCPSSDERAIYSLNLAVEKQADLLDSSDHLMFIIFSDEDERSSKQFMANNSLLLQSKDLPETLVETVYTHLGAAKTFSVHSIIIPPGDEQCLNEQNRNAYQGAGSGGVITENCMPNCPKPKIRSFDPAAVF